MIQFLNWGAVGIMRRQSGFFRSLKDEQLNHDKLAKQSIIDYLAFYNGKRAYSKSGYQSPLEFER